MKKALFIAVLVCALFLPSCEVEYRGDMRYHHYRGYEHSHYPDHHDMYNHGYHHDEHGDEIIVELSRQQQKTNY
jgi:hypothetical protein